MHEESRVRPLKAVDLPFFKPEAVLQEMLQHAACCRLQPRDAARDPAAEHRLRRLMLYRRTVISPERRVLQEQRFLPDLRLIAPASKRREEREQCLFSVAALLREPRPVIAQAIREIRHRVALRRDLLREAQPLRAADLKRRKDLLQLPDEVRGRLRLSVRRHRRIT